MCACASERDSESERTNERRTNERAVETASNERTAVRKKERLYILSLFLSLSLSPRQFTLSRTSSSRLCSREVGSRGVMAYAEIGVATRTSLSRESVLVRSLASSTHR